MDVYDGNPRLCILTGIPGSGKSSVAEILRPRLPPGWTVLRSDDFIGPTQACYPGKPWQEIRRLLPFFAGWSAGWYLAMKRGVLMEGHFRDRVEIGRLERGVSALIRHPPPSSIVRLEGDPVAIAGRLASNPQREPEWHGPDRELNFLSWLKLSSLDPDIGGQVVDTRDVPAEDVARRVALAFNLGQE